MHRELILEYWSDLLFIEEQPDHYRSFHRYFSSVVRIQKHRTPPPSLQPCRSSFISHLWFSTSQLALLSNIANVYWSTYWSAPYFSQCMLFTRCYMYLGSSPAITILNRQPRRFRKSGCSGSRRSEAQVTPLGVVTKGMRIDIASNIVSVFLCCEFFVMICYFYKDL